jgi:4a-hydroxytetrahydrobiopterin dehydratase
MRLIDRHCVHDAAALDDAAIRSLLPEVPDWHVNGTRLEREFVFRDFHETMEFVNALAFMIHREDHHPDLTVGYRRVTAAWTTHSAGNRLSDNDFICAARADALYAGRAGA